LKGAKNMTGANVSGTPDGSAPKTAAGSLTNAQRLRAHLVKSGLAESLLDAWQDGAAAEAQNRMLAALDNFLKPGAAQK
jgi:hypothetical protein